MEIQCDIAPGQTLKVGLMTPSDAPEVARLFLSVYGNECAIRTYLDPERPLGENLMRTIISAVAWTKGACHR